MAAAIAAAVIGIVVTPLLSNSVVPSIQDRDVLVRMETPTGTSNTKTTAIATALSKQLRAIDGVDNVVGAVGRAITGDRIVDVNSGEMIVVDRQRRRLRRDDRAHPANRRQDPERRGHGLLLHRPAHPRRRRRDSRREPRPRRRPRRHDRRGPSHHGAGLRREPGRAQEAGHPRSARSSARSTASRRRRWRNRRNSPRWRSRSTSTRPPSTASSRATSDDPKPSCSRASWSAACSRTRRSSTSSSRATRRSPRARSSLAEPAHRHRRRLDGASLPGRRRPGGPHSDRHRPRRRLAQARHHRRRRGQERGAGGRRAREAAARTRDAEEYHAEVLDRTVDEEINFGNIAGAGIGALLAALLLFQALFRSWRLAIGAVLAVVASAIGGVVAGLVLCGRPDRGCRARDCSRSARWLRGTSR